MKWEEYKKTRPWLDELDSYPPPKFTERAYCEECDTAADIATCPSCKRRVCAECWTFPPRLEKITEGTCFMCLVENCGCEHKKFNPRT